MQSRPTARSHRRQARIRPDASLLVRILQSKALARPRDAGAHLFLERPTARPVFPGAYIWCTHYETMRKAYATAHAFKVWRRQESNLRHPACKAGALPTELRPRGGGKETRTPDPHAASVMLYQLSYAPKNGARPGDPPLFTPPGVTPLMLYYAREVRRAIAHCGECRRRVRKVRAS